MISKETRLDELSQTLPATAGYLLHRNSDETIKATLASRTLASMAARQGISEVEIERLVSGLNAMLLEKGNMALRRRG